MTEIDKHIKTATKQYFKVDRATLDEVFTYLLSKPYKEVFRLIPALQQSDGPLIDKEETGELDIG